jgi:hypothetical protein
MGTSIAIVVIVAIFSALYFVFAYIIEPKPGDPMFGDPDSPEDWRW